MFSAASTTHRRLALVMVAAAVGLGCAGDDAIGPPDSYVVLGPVTPPAQSEPGRYPVVHKLALDDGPALTLGRLFADGFAGEMVQTVHLVKQLVRNGAPGGHRFPEAARAAAADPLCIVVGAEGGVPHGRGLAFPRWLRSPAERPALVWLGLPTDLSDDKALVQTVSARLATHVAHWVASGGTLGPLSPDGTRLVEGYRMAMEVIGREVRVGRGPQGVPPPTAGTTAQREVFAGVRDGRFVLDASRQQLRPPAEMLADSGVAATVLYNLAQPGIASRRVARPEIYAPFVAGPLPPGVSAAAILGPKRNFQAKLLTAWAGAVLDGKAPTDIVHLLEAYGRLFPEERAEVVRIFLVTTYGATVKPGGVSRRPEDARATLAELTALGVEIAAGKRTLRDALPARN